MLHHNINVIHVTTNKEIEQSHITVSNVECVAKLTILNMHSASIYQTKHTQGLCLSSAIYKAALLQLKNNADSTKHFLISRT